MLIERHFTKAGEDPFDTVEWKTLTASIKNAEGEILFEQEVQAPATWSQRAVNIVASKYFYGDVEAGNGSPADGKREWSVRQLIHRVVTTIVDAAWSNEQQGWLEDEEAEILQDELTWLLLHQYGSFNSPVWFNVGLHHAYGITGDESNQIYGHNPEFGFTGEPMPEIIKVDPYERPQASACFILALDDSIEDIWRLMSDSARLFKYGSGIGSDWSRLRSSKDKLSGGGVPSGPVSFMKVQDTTGGTIKSGGKTRRAAIMQTLRCWHPDVGEFIDAKQNEEQKAWALIEQGYDGSFNGPAYGSVAFQNVNQSVRVTDEFMEKVRIEGMDPDTVYPLRSPATNEVLDHVDVRGLFYSIAHGTYVCGDPGVQYEDTIQKWHTCKASGPINSSNPCSEYMFLDDSACNLASLNLKKFWNGSEFDIPGFRHATRVFITAMETLVDLAGYPTPQVAQNSHDFRPLGLGFTNLGALLMAMGLPYDSDEGRSVAGAIMALEHGEAYYQSGRLARRVGPFTYWNENRTSFIGVLENHREECFERESWNSSNVARPIWREASESCQRMVDWAFDHGIRNAQVTVLAPTGTISFMMDADTTGIEPELALVKTKLLAGAGDGRITIVNETVEEALGVLGYHELHAAEIGTYISKHGTAVGAPKLKEEHLPIFATSFGTENVISWEAHLKMMAACQPFVSGAISKTINMPEDSTVEDIMDAYVLGWELGLKAVAIYRENSKRSQPLSTIEKKIRKKEEVSPVLTKLEPFASEAHAQLSAAHGIPLKPTRRRLPDERESVTHKFSIAGHEGYLHVGLYPTDLQPGEIFIVMAKEGSTLSGLLDAFATSISIGLQYGVPLEKVVDKFKGMKFDPAGFTKNKRVPVASSIMDYVARYLEYKYLEEPDLPDDGTEPEPPEVQQETPVVAASYDGPPCPSCGGMTFKAGSCYTCGNCGDTTGCG